MSASPPPVSARHANRIVTLAVSDDATVVVSQDAFGGTRLWPVLDGSREPIVVTIEPAHELAIARIDDTYLVAAVGLTGDLELARFALDGRRVADVRVAAGEVATDHVEIARDTVLAVRTDHTIAAYAVPMRAGEPASPLRSPRVLAPRPGERIIRLATRHGHALVVVASVAGVRGRWLAGLERPSSVLTFGADTPWLAGVDPARARDAALSPDGTRLAVQKGHGVVAFDLVTGEPGPRLCRHVTGLSGFVSDERVGCLAGGLFEEWLVTGIRIEREERIADEGLVAVGDDVGIGAQLDQLAIHGSATDHFLGYGVASIEKLRVGTDGIIAMSFRGSLVLDDELRATREIRIPDGPRVANDIAPMDDRFALVVDAANVDIAVVDTIAARLVDTLPGVATELRYNPRTRLAAYGDGEASYLARFDPDVPEFPAASRYRIAGPPGEVYVVDPDRAGGVIAVVVRKSANEIAIVELREDDLNRTPIEGRGYTLLGREPWVDDAGRIYTRHVVATSPDLVLGDLVIYRDERELVRLQVENDGVRARWSPDDSAIAVFGQRRASLFEPDGRLRWTVPAPELDDLVWNRDTLIALYRSGLTKIDLATGERTAPACGWEFGLRDRPNGFDVPFASVCDAQ